MSFDVRRGELIFPVRDTPAAGDQQGVMLLLHGWPQDGRSWDEVTPALAEAGYRVCAPDLRGATPSAAPRSRWSYRAGDLIGDVVALIDAIGEPVHLIGHDWGSALGWMVAAERPDLVRTFTAVSVPHPGAFLQSMIPDRQLLKSWYMLLFQLPVVPEALLGSRERVRSLLRSSGQVPAAIERDADRLGDRRLRRGGFNWYRAMFLDSPAGAYRKIDVPVQMVWSDGDVAIGRGGCERSEAFCRAGFSLVTLPGVSHWIPDEAPDELARLVIGHASA